MSGAMRKRLLDILRKNANRFDYGGLMMRKNGMPKKFKLREHNYPVGKRIKGQKYVTKKVADYSDYQRFVVENMPRTRDFFMEKHSNLVDEPWFHRKIAELSMRSIGKKWTRENPPEAKRARAEAVKQRRLAQRRANRQVLGDAAINAQVNAIELQDFVDDNARALREAKAERKRINALKKLGNFASSRFGQSSGGFYY